MADHDEAERLEEQIEALEASFGAAASLAAGFDAELRRIHETFSATGKGAARLEASLSRGLRRAIDGIVFDGFRASEALEAVGRSLIATAYDAAVKPVTDHFGGLIADAVGGLFGGLAGFARGGGFTDGRVMPFAEGGIVTRPTLFPMRGGAGLMGEAGPEAILPLARGADGRLGVRAEGASARPVTVVVNVSTPDVAGFRRSQGQIAAEMGRALARGQRYR